MNETDLEIEVVLNLTNDMTEATFEVQKVAVDFKHQDGRTESIETRVVDSFKLRNLAMERQYDMSALISLPNA